MLVLLLISAKALQCDLTLNTGICIYSGNNVVRPFTKPSGVNGFWTFDDVYGLDYSGNGNHAKKVVPAGHSSGRSTGHPVLLKIILTFNNEIHHS